MTAKERDAVYERMIKITSTEGIGAKKLCRGILWLLGENQNMDEMDMAVRFARCRHLVKTFLKFYEDKGGE